MPSLQSVSEEKNVDYTDHAIRDVLLNGISDPDIHREVLETKNVLHSPVKDVIALVENKEMARTALPSATLSTVPSFKRHSLLGSQRNSTTARWNRAAPWFTSAALSKPFTYRTTHYSTLVSSPRTFPHSRPRTYRRRGATQATLTLQTLTHEPPPINAVGLSTTAATQQVTNLTSCAHALSVQPHGHVPPSCPSLALQKPTG